MTEPKYEDDPLTKILVLTGLYNDGQVYREDYLSRLGIILWKMPEPDLEVLTGILVKGIIEAQEGEPK